ncbi:MAG: hypothetical protein ACR2QB_06525 [Gammaproteobacteria bacterium]
MTQPLTRFSAGLLIVATSLLVGNPIALATMQKLGDSVEIATIDVPLSQMRTGTVSLRRCADCKVSLLRVDEKTVFHVNGTNEDDMTDDLTAKREIFLEHARKASGRAGIITVFIELDSNYVRSMRLSPRPGD